MRSALADRAIPVDAADDADETDAVAAAEEAAWTADTSQVLTDSLQLFLQDVGKHKLLNSLEDVREEKEKSRIPGIPLAVKPLYTVTTSFPPKSV